MKTEYKKILVTGSAGWLGKGVLNALLHGIPECETLREPLSNTDVAIRALVLPHEIDELNFFEDGLDICVGDVTNVDDCKKFFEDSEGALLIHLVGIIHPKSRVKEFFDVNLDGTKNILKSAVDAGVKRAVIMSSNSPIGCNPYSQHQFDEDSPYNPYMNYGYSKQLMEEYVKGVQKSEKIETVIIRAPWFYGPFQPERQLEFFEMIRDGKGPIVGSGENRRSMAYIDNLAQGIILAGITDAANGEVYWVADKTPYTMNEVIDTIERLLDKEFKQDCKFKRLKLPGIVSEIAFWIDKSIQGLGLYHQKMHVLSEMNKTISCSIEKAERELGYKPMIALEEGMRRSLSSFFKK